MTNQQKDILRWQVNHLLSKGKTHGVIVSRLIREGFKKSTIKNYIKALTPQQLTSK